MELDFQTLKYFFDLSPDLFVIVSKEGQFIYINSAWKAYLGYREEEMLGEHFLSFVAPEDRENTSREYQEYIEKGARRRPIFENRYRAKNGTIYNFQWNAFFDEKTERFYCVVRDVTPYRTIHKLKKSLYDTTYESIKLAMVKDIASEVANEMSDPLFTVGGHAELIDIHINKSNLDADYILEQTRQIQTSLTKLSKLMKSLSRLTASLDTQDVSTFLLSQLIRDIRLLIQRRSLVSNIEIRDDNINSEAHVSCQKSELTQLLYQVLTTCIKNCDITKDTKINFWTLEKDKKYIDLFIETENLSVNIESYFSRDYTPLFDSLSISKENGQTTFKVRLELA